MDRPYEHAVTRSAPSYAQHIEVHDRIVAGGAGRLAVRDHAGDGLPIVIAHGWGDNLVTWDVLAEALAPHRVVTFDQRSHGWSDVSDELGHRSVAADIEAVVAALDVGMHVVVGHSWGAMTATVHAASTASCRGLLCLDQALLDHPPTEFARTVDEALAAVAMPLEGATEAEFEQFVAGVAGLGETTEAFYRRGHHLVDGRIQPHPSGRHTVWLERCEAEEQPVEHHYEHIRCPVRWVISRPPSDGPGMWGFAPPGTREELVDGLLERHPHLRGDRVAIDAGHLMHLERPVEVAGLIRDFAASCEAEDR